MDRFKVVNNVLKDNNKVFDFGPDEFPLTKGLDLENVAAALSQISTKKNEMDIDNDGLIALALLVPHKNDNFEDVAAKLYELKSLEDISDYFIDSFEISDENLVSEGLNGERDYLFSYNQNNVNVFVLIEVDSELSSKITDLWENTFLKFMG